MQGFHRRWSHGHGLLPVTVETFASVLREATVEVESEFVEIPLLMSGRHGPLLGATQTAFQQADDQMNVVKFLLPSRSKRNPLGSLESSSHLEKFLRNRRQEILFHANRAFPF